MPSVVFLEGKKVNLRPLDPEKDLEKCHLWVNDPEVRQFIGCQFPTSIGKEKNFLEELNKDSSNIILGIEVKEGGDLIGVVGLHRINWIDGVANTGTLIGPKDFWGKGFGTDTKMTLLDYAFGTLNLRKICSSAISFNGRSIGHNLKCGYKIEGKRRKQFFRNGKYYDEVLLCIFRNQFLKAQKKYLDSF